MRTGGPKVSSLALYHWANVAMLRREHRQLVMFMLTEWFLVFHVVSNLDGNLPDNCNQVWKCRVFSDLIAIKSKNTLHF